MFIAYQVSLEAIRTLRPLIPKIAARDRALASQLQEAATSVPLTLAEGSRRHGRDATQHYRIAAGSAGESIAALETAVAWGYLEPHETAAAAGHLDRVLALTWPLRR